MIGVVADDLTGAAEIGAVGLRHGLKAEVLIEDVDDLDSRKPAPSPCSSPPMGERKLPPLEASKANPFTSLICVDTDSRSCAPDDATSS